MKLMTSPESSNNRYSKKTYWAKVLYIRVNLSFSITGMTVCEVF